MAGAKMWMVPDAYYPATSTQGAYVSHESVCVLNTSNQDAKIHLTLYFEDRDKMDSFEAVCKAERTHHIRLDKLMDANGNGVPRGVPYAILVQSDCDIVVQYTRLDTTQAELALMTAMAFPV
jgi:hypothetical protein